MSTRHVFWGAMAFVLLVLETDGVDGQQAKNVVIADFVPTENLYQQPSFPYNDQMSLADLWGWTYNGEEYVLVCLLGSFQGNGLSMVKITDPNKATIIKTIRRGQGGILENYTEDVRVLNNHAYVCRNNSENYYVNLITALNNPSDPFAGHTDFNAGTTIHNLYINTSNALLFLCDFPLTSPQILVYRIDAVSPVLLYSIPSTVAGRPHDLSATTTRIHSASNVDGLRLIDYTYVEESHEWDLDEYRIHKYNNKRGHPPNDYAGGDTLKTAAHDAVISTNGDWLYSTDERNGDDVAEGSSTRQLAAHLKIRKVKETCSPRLSRWRSCKESSVKRSSTSRNSPRIILKKRPEF